jgi:hypothetical protein
VIPGGHGSGGSSSSSSTSCDAQQIDRKQLEIASIVASVFCITAKRFKPRACAK